MGLAVLSALSVVTVEPLHVIYVVLGALAMFVPLNLVLRRYHRGTRLHPPGFLPLRVVERGAAILGVAIVLLLAYCLYHWPYGPFKPSDGGYVDKRGRGATEADYRGLRRWETVYFSTWGACCVLGAVTLPFAKTGVRREA